jgi:hypothetical protein
MDWQQQSLGLTLPILYAIILEKVTAIMPFQTISAHLILCLLLFYSKPILKQRQLTVIQFIDHV